MKIKLDFLKPQLINIILTFVVLCLPLLREQYNGGQYVTWNRPIELIVQYLQNPHNQSYFPIFMVMVLFSLVVYILTSALVAWIENSRVKGLKIS